MAIPALAQAPAMNEGTHSLDPYVPIMPGFERNMEVLLEKSFWASQILASARNHGIDGNLMVRIATCESGLVPNKWNYLHDTNPSVYTAYGLFQVVKSHDAQYGLNRMDPYDNIELAMRLYQDHGTTPWNASKSCWQ